MQFSIHKMGQLAPEFIEAILDIDRAGFDSDYISDRLLLSTTFADGMLQTAAGTRYRGLVIPECRMMPAEVKAHIEKLKAQGAHIIYGTRAEDLRKAARPEAMKSACGLKAIRRRNDAGHHYFIANLSPRDVQERVPLAVPFKSAVWFNPLNGDVEPACVSGDSVEVSLRSGESRILVLWNVECGMWNEECNSRNVECGMWNENTFATKSATDIPHSTFHIPHSTKNLVNWELKFTEESPKVSKTFTLDTPQGWETLGDDSARVTMGTGVYNTHVKLTKAEARGRWAIELGDVRESARVYINGRLIGCAWSVPFVLDCRNALRAGDNEIRIEVTNLPANRIADLDRRGVKWRKMEEINVVDINYRRTTYADWEPVPSGLTSEVRLVSLP